MNASEVPKRRPRKARGSIARSTMLLISVAATSTRAGSQTVEPTFSGIVSRVSTVSIEVTDPATKKSERFSIVHTHGYGAVSADGKTTYQFAAITVGWDIKIAYSEDAHGQRHADHIVLLR